MKMHIEYTNPGFEHSVESMLLFQTEGESAYWTDSIYYFYPELDKARIDSLDAAGKREYMISELRKIYDSLQNTWSEKLDAYNDHWAKHRAQVNDSLSDAFGVDAHVLFNDLRGHITLNPVCPRFLRERRFDIFHMNSHRGCIGITIHEMIHFLWFHVWNSLYHDGYDEYERPSLKWILSEMVVESIMRDKRLSSINPYFPRENGGCIYGYFQDMVIENRPILETLDEMYRADSMTGFMKRSYSYCMKNEKAIRAHIEKAEQTF